MVMNIRNDKYTPDYSSVGQIQPEFPVGIYVECSSQKFQMEHDINTDIKLCSFELLFQHMQRYICQYMLACSEYQQYTSKEELISRWDY